MATTRIQTLLGLELPIIQAPMAGAQGSALAIAVSNAGGLGSLPGATIGLDALREELQPNGAHPSDHGAPRARHRQFG
jgi:nitronate monooxygenase